MPVPVCFSVHFYNGEKRGKGEEERDKEYVKEEEEETKETEVGITLNLYVDQ